MKDKYGSPFGPAPRRIPHPAKFSFSDMEQRMLADVMLDGDAYRGMAMTTSTVTNRAATMTASQMLDATAKVHLPYNIGEDDPKHYEDLGVMMAAIPVAPEPPKPRFKVTGASYKDVMMSPRALAAAIDEVCDVLPRMMELCKADVLVAVGTSGCAIVAPVAARMGIPWLLVRKGSDKSHGRSVEGLYCGTGRAIFIDDCVCSGGTKRHAASKLGPLGIDLVGQIMYLSTKEEPYETGPDVWACGSDVNSGRLAAQCRDDLGWA